MPTFIYDAVRTPRAKARPDGTLAAIKPQDMVAGLVDALEARVEGSRHQIREPARVGFGKKPLGVRREEPAGEMNDRSDAGDRGRERRRVGQVRLHGLHVGQVREVGGNRRPAVHQPKLMAARDEVAREQATEVPGSAGDQDGRLSVTSGTVQGDSPSGDT